MASRSKRATGHPDLFTAVEIEDDQQAAQKGERKHTHLKDTDTDWGPPVGLRMTSTCLGCGYIFGRIYKTNRGNGRR